MPPVFLPIVPNWQNGVRDTYEFKTDVFVSRDGTEQRRSQRVQPRRSITAAVLLDGDRLRVFSDAINAAKDGKVQVADFSADGAVLTETVADGATVLKVDHVPAWLTGSQPAVLLTGRKAQKVGVDFISGNQVILTAGVKGAVGFGAQLLPMLPAVLSATTSTSVYTNLVSTSSLTLQVEPGTVTREADPLPADSSPTSETKQVIGPAAIFYGRYALLRKPNYLQQPQVAFNLAYESVDYDRGVVKTFAPVPLVSRTLTATYMGVSHAETMALLDIFVRAKGRAGEIYVPTWGNDFPPILSIIDNKIMVDDPNFTNTYGDDRAHKAILIRKKDGTLHPFEIRSMTFSGGNSVIVTDNNVSVAPSDVEAVSWMFVSRFAQDSLTLEWRTNGVANITLSFTTLANLAAEDSYGSNWILATGYWRDGGIWQDAAVWED
ncbi:hypothetical protein [Manganibacter manganicus]|uniref:Uncharacterized protein n=1 Tax=Manganibacter manganicus TaxID=1873176 RepID=A0A1V8RQW6_9HYPH|nr:hypothetical protein [Pseudaminobacter manganicus]OQM75600.1 hypothetical protein BFN67_17665 [Pseudaminobacter manganicus]